MDAATAQFKLIKLQNETSTAIFWGPV